MIGLVAAMAVLVTALVAIGIALAVRHIRRRQEEKDFSRQVNVATRSRFGTSFNDFGSVRSKFSQPSNADDDSVSNVDSGSVNTIS